MCLVIECDTWHNESCNSIILAPGQQFWSCHPHSVNNKWQGKHSSSAKHLSCTAPGSLATEIAQGLYLESARAECGECQTTGCGKRTNCKADISTL